MGSYRIIPTPGDLKVFDIQFSRSVAFSWSIYIRQHSDRKMVTKLGSRYWGKVDSEDNVRISLECRQYVGDRISPDARSGVIRERYKETYTYRHFITVLMYELSKGWCFDYYFRLGRCNFFEIEFMVSYSMKSSLDTSQSNHIARHTCKLKNLVSVPAPSDTIWVTLLPFRFTTLSINRSIDRVRTKVPAFNSCCRREYLGW